MKRLLITIILSLFSSTMIAQSEYSYLYWFDYDHEHKFTGIDYNSISLELDATHLEQGFHTLHIMMLDSNGYWSMPRSHIFYKAPYQSDGYDLDYIYWFDQDYSNRQTGLSGSGNILIETSSLSEGLHTLNVRLGNRPAAIIESHYFYKSIPEWNVNDTTMQVFYWFDQETSVHRLNSVDEIHLFNVHDVICGNRGSIHFIYKDGSGNSSSILTRPFVMMDADCCIPPLFVKIDSITTTTARMHWDYNRSVNFTIAYDTTDFNPDSATNTIAVADTLFRFNSLDSGYTYYYAIKTDCYSGSNPWVTGHFSTVCRTYTDIDTVVCDRLEWHGNILTETGLHYDTLISMNGDNGTCDSIFRINLTIIHSTTGVDSVEACRSYQWIDGNSYNHSEYDAQYTISNRVGCDSIVTLNLTLNQPIHPDTLFFDTACTNYQWHDFIYSESGTYIYRHDHLDSQCPSFDTLNLIIKPSYYFYITTT